MHDDDDDDDYTSVLWTMFVLVFFLHCMSRNLNLSSKSNSYEFTTHCRRVSRLTVDYSFVDPDLQQTDTDPHHCTIPFRMCLLSPACDMFGYKDQTCTFFPFIKLKGRIQSEVSRLLFDVFSRLLYFTLLLNYIITVIMFGPGRGLHNFTIFSRIEIFRKLFRWNWIFH